MKKRPEYEFCMKQFKPAIAGLTLVLLAIIGWTSWHCVDSPRYHRLQLVAAQTPSGPPIGIKDKMLHPYWGNCNKCHITTGAGKPVSKVMTGPPITIKQTMPHKYWGNCMLCHQVTDGFQSPAHNKAPRMRAAAFQQISAAAVGLNLQAVTMALMQQFGLANEDGLLVLAVSPGSAAANAGLLPGDEIVRAGRSRLDTVNDFEAVLNTAKTGEAIKLQIYRGARARSLFLKKTGNASSTAGRMPLSQNQVETLAEQLGVTKTPQAINRALTQQQAQSTAMQAPMTQNQIETLAERLGVPKTPQAVNQALAQQRQSRPVAMFSSGPVAVAATGPGPNYAVSSQFDTSLYFVVYDPAQRAYRVAANPNANDLTGHGVQSGQLMVDLNVTAVIAGQFSPEALQTLHTLRVSAYGGVTGTVQNALNAYSAHGLAPAQANITAAATVYAQPTGNTAPSAGNLPNNGVY